MVHALRSTRVLVAFVVMAALAVAWMGLTPEPPDRVLVFSKTAGFRHNSIEVGVEAFRRLGAEHGFEVEATEDASIFNEADLQRFGAVVFLNTTGDVLDKAQQNDFERYIQAGGGYLGVHAASDTEYDWAWYGDLVGAYFASHPNNPNVRTAMFDRVDADHPSTEGMPERFERSDEFYNFRDINPAIRTLVTIDESTYEGGSNGDPHPMSWYHEYDGGRAFYTAMGHTEESYAEPLVLDHLLGGLRWVMAGEELDLGRARTPRVPEENRFSKVVLADHLEEPMELAVLPDNSVLFIERRGAVKHYDAATGTVETVATIPVSTEYTDGERAEDGLLGLALDPGFETNHWVYLYYSPAGDDPVNLLTRYEFRDGDLQEGTREVVLRVPVQRDECCHTGGSITFDADGNLYLSTGDNTNPFESDGFSPIDERPGRSAFDAQGTSSNTNDLRGKILRIRPTADGGYTIPDGNLFEPGTPNTRPEIYTMGHRNPFRISVDPRTGYLYWGDIGPDASEPAADRGPAGHDEFNQARTPGYYGWPYFVGDNKAYHDYDFATEVSGQTFDPNAAENLSPNNTGRREMPPARPAYIWYPAAPSPEFPILGTGGRSAMAGPVYYHDEFEGAERPFPEYYDGKLFLYEWMRGWILTATMDDEGDLVELERFMPSYTFSNPIDMAFGPEGDLYLLEYGPRWFAGAPEARLVRIEYEAGNRTPLAVATPDRVAGAVPLRVTFDAEGTIDYDDDALTYAWTVTDASGRTVARSDEPAPTFTLDEPGVYAATLTVSDPSGANATARTELVAGNEPPEVTLDIVGGNRMFFVPGEPIRYAVRVTDREDGSLADGGIAEAEVAMTASYLAEGFDAVEVAQGHRAADELVQHAAAQRIIAGSTCMGCHQVDAASIGPAYLAVAERYADDPEAQAYLVEKIRGGGSGVWGEVMMPPHPQLTEDEAARIADYILSLDDVQPEAPTLPLAGTYAPDIEEGAPRGAVVLRAAYTDRGADGLPPASADEVVVLRAPVLRGVDADVQEGVMTYSVPDPPMDIVIATDVDQYIAFEDIDLTGIEAITALVSAPQPQLNAAGGHIEVRLGGPNGTLLGTTPRVEPGGVGEMTPLTTAITPTQGVHDVYFVMKTDGPRTAQQGLFVLTDIHLGAFASEPVGQEMGGAQPASTSPAGGAGLSAGSTIRVLLADERAREVLERHLPGFTADPRLDQAMDMSLRAVAPYAPAVLTDAVVAAIDADLKKLD